MENYQHSNEVLERLWLGDYHASQDEAFLRGSHIDVVMNCTKDLPFKNIAEYQYRIPLDDNLEEAEIRNAGLWAPEIVMTLLKHYKQGHRILVHCMAGRQRSAASVAMFLIFQKHFTTNQAIRYLREKRPVAFMPQPNFLESIQEFEKHYQQHIAPLLMGFHL
jgi:hypothetical protein